MIGRCDNSSPPGNLVFAFSGTSSPSRPPPAHSRASIGAMTGDITSRPPAGDPDWWAVRSLIVDLFGRLPLGSAWEVRRWDGLRFHDERPEIPDRCRLWFAGERLVAAAFSEGSGSDVHLQVDPIHRGLEAEMLDWAVTHLALDGRLDHVVFEGDRSRTPLLAERAFAPTEEGEVMQRRRLDADRPPAPGPPPGYRFRSTRGTGEDYSRMAALLDEAFGRTTHTAGEYRTFCERSPSFRHELNLVAEAPDGSFAAHAGLTYDAANRCAIVEPVCTAPGHRRLGLALGLVVEGLRRARLLGARAAVVGAGLGEGPNRLYEAAGFAEVGRGRLWRLAR